MHALNPDASQVDQCIDCPPGRYCPNAGGTASAGDCVRGHYCAGAAASMAPTDGVTGDACPGGHYCPTGTGAPFACPNGTYNDAEGSTNSSDCKPCPGGQYCGAPGLMAPSGNCSAGYYCPGGLEVGQAHPTPFEYLCPSGYFCPAGAVAPLHCPAGSYSDQAGAEACTACLAGFYCNRFEHVAVAGCPEPFTNYTVPTACPAGHYCPTGTARGDDNPCPVGTYSPDMGLTTAESCVACPAGQYCGSPGLTAPTGPCNASYYCLNSSTTPQPLTGEFGGPCPVGHYCPSGTGYPVPCPAGTYNPNTHGSSEGNCQPCSAGYFCAQPGLAAPTGTCWGGWYCPEGQAVPNPAAYVCPIGFYCPIGSVQPLNCPAGLYSDTPNQFKCRLCPSGYFCDVLDKCDIHCLDPAQCEPYDNCTNATSQPRDCPPGHYCLNGTRYGTQFACGAGTYNPGYNLAAPAECHGCPAGEYCESAGLAVPTGPCMAGHYCSGSARRPDPTDNVTGALCTPGHYCPEGSPAPVPCPAGTFSTVTGARNASECTACLPGQYCNGLGLTAPTGPCLQGFYCPAGTAYPGTLPSASCPFGYHCPEGSVAPVVCPSGYFQDDVQQHTCKLCPSGYYCDLEDKCDGTNYTQPQACPPGHYCLNGTTHGTEYPCPTGTYNAGTKLESAGDCTPCTPGHYCETAGLAAPTDACSASFYCTAGAETATPLDGAQGGLCPPGAYCPAGSGAPVLCPGGTFNSKFGSANLSHCEPCTAGYYCDQSNLTGPVNECTAGFYCPEGTVTPALVCPFGYHCPVGSPAPVNCPSGTYQDEEGQRGCKTCPEGYYCDLEEKCLYASALATNASTVQIPDFEDDVMCDGNGTNGTGCSCSCRPPLADVPTYATTTTAFSQPRQCPPGHYCTNGTAYATQHKCPIGTYSDQTALRSAEECTPCAPGHYCASAGLGVPTGPCAPGFYCVSGASHPAPTDNVTGNVCIPGHYCPEGSSFPVPCPAGTFSSGVANANLTQCEPCTAGMYCSGGALLQPTGPCAETFYCPEGTAEPSLLCPFGYHCPAGSAEPLNCPSGFYQDEVGRAVCKVCPAGFYCDLEDKCSGQNFTQPTPCPEGHYCPEGTNRSTQYPCPAGTYNNVTGLSAVSGCAACSPGAYCETAGLVKPTGLCDPSYYCLAGATNPAPVDGMTGDICPPGFYCHVGTGAPLACPAGTFSPQTGVADVTGCQPCTSGSYCSDAGLVQPVGLCMEGYYCETGTQVPYLVCPIGYQCPQGSHSPVVCPAGTYQDQEGKGYCKGCPRGFYCDLEEPCGNSTATQPRVCPAGHYCPNGTRFATEWPCPAGTFSNRTGVQAPEACSQCLPGYYCEGPGLLEPTGPCDPGYYCLAGSDTGTPRTLVNGTVRVPSVGDYCPAGSYCPAASPNPQPCPPGTFNPAQGMAAPAACEPCTAGHACTLEGLSAPYLPCQAGYYCPSGTVFRNLWDNRCPVGHYCPAGTAEPRSCPAGLYTSTYGRYTCWVCPAGFYCAEPPAGNASAPQPCPAAHYCPNGTRHATQFPCPVGTYSNATALETAADCLPCAPGHYCADLALQEPSGPCAAGYFCTGGSTVAEPTDGVVGGGCPAGHYCPEASAQPTPCPMGTYNGANMSQSLSDCAACPPAMYCDATGLTAPVGSCPATLYCPEGTGNPSLLCPLGYQCPEGVASPLDCPSGEYQDAPGQAQCIVCPEGYYCDLDEKCNKTAWGHGLYTVPRDCPAGHYCPAGTKFATEFPCPVPTFSNATNLKGVGECQQCPPGAYCASAGLTAPTGLCAASWYCRGSSNSSHPETGPTGGYCPAGYYCPEGTPAPQACPEGTYNAKEGSMALDNCTLCDLGHYCPLTALTQPYNPCYPGFYCHEGETSAQPADKKCPYGHYCPRGSSTWQRCPPGTYSNHPGQYVCKVCPAGHYCDYDAANLTDYIVPEICPAGHFCPNGTRMATQFPCPVGTFHNETGLRSSDECPPCLPGTYCGEAGLRAPTGPCAASYYCSGGASVPRPMDGLTGDICPVGYYCPEGTLGPVPCPPGTFGPKNGTAAVEECEPCTPGMYCESAALVFPTGPCPARFFCPEGTDVPALLCPFGSYCPDGVGVPLTCPSGTHQDEPAKADCKECPRGFYCDREEKCLFPVTYNTTELSTCRDQWDCSNTTNVTLGNATQYLPPGAEGPLPCQALTTAFTQPQPCPAGHYCPSGVKFGTEYPCAPGTYGPSTHMVSAEDCLECPPGLYCLTSGLAEPTGNCSAGYYCTGSSDTPNPMGGAMGDVCPIGHYCPAGAHWPVACPPGTFNRKVGAMDVSHCDLCTGGQYCNQFALAEPVATCGAGYYCPAGTSEEESYACPAGYHCPEGTHYPVQCDPGYYQDLEGQSQCRVCPAGYYCDLDDKCDVGNFTQPRDCPPGHYCLQGTRFATQYPCPVGTFSPVTRLVDIAQCLPCTPGSYCDAPGLSVPAGPCAASYFCNGSAVTAQPTDGQSGDLCPPGAYCPAGTAEPLLCPPGTYNDAASSWRLAHCKLCPGGQYCSGYGLQEPGPLCTAGYYCPEGTAVPTLECPYGWHCPEGSMSPVNCPSGYFQDEAGQAQCKLCPEGYYCDLDDKCPYASYMPQAFQSVSVDPQTVFSPNASVLNATTCVEDGGYWVYVSDGNSSYYTYCNGTLTDADACVNVTANASRILSGLHGTAMPTTCLPAPDTPLPGSQLYNVELLLSNYTQPQPCPAGYYCPNGTKFATEFPCPAGTFSNETLLTREGQCTPCLAGYYCETSALLFPTGPCAPSFYCTGRTVVSMPTDGVTGDVCPVGHYCPEGSPQPVPCPAGTFSGRTAAFELAQCDACVASQYCPSSGMALPGPLCFAGFYCPPSTPYPSLYCPFGFHCPLGSAEPKNCPSGYHQDEVQQDYCKECPAGYYCDLGDKCPPAVWYNTSVNATTCLNGTNGSRVNCSTEAALVTNEGGFTQPRPCPAGHYCPNRTLYASQYPCPVGTYNNVTLLESEDQCLPCAPGHYCATPGLQRPTGLCAQSYYCEGGSSTPTPQDGVAGGLCTPGHYCPAGSALPTPCPEGTLNAKPGSHNVSQCDPCTPGYYCATPGLTNATAKCHAGYYCPSGVSVPTPPEYICPFGYQCPLGSVAPHPCPSGTHSDVPGLEACKPCPAGFYCDLDDHCLVGENYTQPRACPEGHYCLPGTDYATRYPCPPGTFNNKTGLASVEECTLCLAGQYCPTPGLSEPTGPCAAGYYCNNGSTTPYPRDQRCPPGSYCPEGTVGPLLCPPSTFNPRYGAPNISACEPCTGGQYCGESGGTAPTGDCAGGYYCPQGQRLPNPPGLECPFGYYCPPGSFAPVTCPAGYHTNQSGTEACLPCPPGTYCDLDDKCAGENYTQPRDCPPGHYCLEGTQYPTQYPCPVGTFNNITNLRSADECFNCTAGSYCASTGLTAPTGPCDGGYYCSGGARVPNQHGCPAGHFCFPGTSYPDPCPVGTYNPRTGAANVTECYPCTQSFYCGREGLVQPDTCCDAGYYCPGGDEIATSIPCPVGYYCPRCSAHPNNCPSGYYQDLEGQGTCKPCEKGHYCSEDEPWANYTVPRPCPPGFFCPSGTKFAHEWPCPLGYYRDSYSMTTDYQCFPCPASQFCGQEGLQLPSGPCEAGYYCTGAAQSPAPTDSISGNMCPPGHYCPKGSSYPVACPISRRYSGSRAKKLEDCLPCPPGHYCSEYGLANYTGNCRGGFYCPGGQNISAPEEYFCLRGYHCPPGSAWPTRCPGGTYQNSTHQTTCNICPQGYYCPPGSFLPEICPMGAYCPEATEFPIKCPPGSYSYDVGLVDARQCLPCPNGTYCLEGEIVGDCLCGFICRHSSARPDPDYEDSRGGICPLGHYCPAGTTEAIPCSNGTLGYQPGLCSQSECLPCRAGFYCESWSILPIPCPPGWYCPEAEGRLPCPPGTWQPYMHQSNASACLPCVTGYACPDPTMPNYDQYVCPEGHYCPPGTADPLPCPGGTYRDMLNGTTVTDCVPCTCGHYCPPGSELPIVCPDGSYCPEMATNASVCPGGYYCTGRLTVGGVGSCEPEICPPGHFCPPASPFYYECYNGTYCPRGTEIPNLCPLGWASVNDSLVRDTLEASCTPCPAGMYGNHPFRMYCQTCDPGYVCLTAATDPRPENRTAQRGYPCPKGHYCPAGVTSEIPCPIGTYGDTLRESEIDQVFARLSFVSSPVSSVFAPSFLVFAPILCGDW